MRDCEKGKESFLLTPDDLLKQEFIEEKTVRDLQLELCRPWRGVWRFSVKDLGDVRDILQ